MGLSLPARPGVSAKAVLKITGDKYRLSGTDRSMLYRGITSSHNAIWRRQRFVEAAALSGCELAIDGYNVLITIGSYLNGNAVFILIGKTI